LLCAERLASKASWLGGCNLVYFVRLSASTQIMTPHLNSCNDRSDGEKSSSHGKIATHDWITGGLLPCQMAKNRGGGGALTSTLASWRDKTPGKAAEETSELKKEKRYEKWPGP